MKLIKTKEEDVTHSNMFEWLKSPVVSNSFQKFYHRHLSLQRQALFKII